MKRQLPEAVQSARGSQPPRPKRGARAAAFGALTAVVATGTMLAAPVPASAATNSDIKLAQTDLNGLAYRAGSVDGISGPETRQATESFQSDRCLDIDGLIGPQTLNRLRGVVKQVQVKVTVPANETYDKTTTAAVKKYQNTHKLPANGLADAATMKSLGIARTVTSCHATTALRAKIVKVARSQLGTYADSRLCVKGKPYNVCGQWCAAFATWVWRKAGENIPSMTYVPAVNEWAVKHHRWIGTSGLHSAKPGDLIIYGSAHNRFHIGIVDHVSGGHVDVISGNTSDPNGAHSSGVYEKRFPLSGAFFYGLVRA
ncbi:peptidoglycan-binding protein [Streptomyces orinoci]|uniref:Peptidoglycan-binding protein n=1 Tax=Streptomyces orinoci TaxID=67339 RepID=A0ABV3JWK3_STRON|nr:peptidoglycan-binding protein [Streptomyces orinoci]